MSTEYASAVAAVRAMETTLLGQNDLTRMIAAENIASLTELLTAAGKNVPPKAEQMLYALDRELEEVWQFLQEYAPEDPTLEILVYRNNFHNVKAAIKAFVVQTDPQRLFLQPTTLDLKALPGIAAEKAYDTLPVYLQEPAETAYEILTKTLDGQLADAILDTAALQAMQEAADAQKSPLMQQYTQTVTACADIKTAYRCSLMQKSEGFLQTAVCGSRELDKNFLIRAALKGPEGFCSALEGTSWQDAAAALNHSPATFEKWCDDTVTQLLEAAKLQAFGVEPLAAYYLAKETEIRNLRILFVCKSHGVSQETITERMRMLYE